MKTKLFLLIWLQVSVALVQAQGYVVPNGVTYGGLNAGNGYEIDVISSEAYSRSTRFFLNPVGKTQPTVYTNTFSFSEFLDSGVRVFLVSSNDAISLQPILSQSWTELGYGTSYVFQSGVPFYLALYTGSFFAPPYPPNPPFDYLDPEFGWVELVNNQGVIQMLGGAIEYGGVGIVAGTQIVIQAVPEPNAWSLLGLSALLVGGWHWKNRGAA